MRQLSIYPLALCRFLLQCDLELSLTVYFCFSLELFDTADVLQVFIKKKLFKLNDSFTLYEQSEKFHDCSLLYFLCSEADMMHLI